MPGETRTVRCGDIDICLSVAGRGPALLFIGGTGWDLRASPAPITSLLTDHFTVALFDQRGQGRTSKPPGPYTMAGYAEDACAVADVLGWETPHVVGYSFGGMVAQEYAIRFPDRLDRLVLAATTSGGVGGASFPVHRLLELPPADRARRGLQTSDRRFSALEEASPREADAMVQKRMAAQTRFTDEPGARAGLRAQLAARAAHDCYDRLDRITAPTLVLAGEDDLQAPVAAQRRLADRIPDARFRRVPGAHNFIFEGPAGYEQIAEFLTT